MIAEQLPADAQLVVKSHVTVKNRFEYEFFLGDEMRGLDCA